jgi:hypothetical protein
MGDEIGKSPMTTVPALAKARFAARDANGLLALAEHENEVVREMLAQQLLREAQAGGDLESALPALERLIQDREFGGVMFHATQALLLAVERGLDVSRLVPTLSKYTDEFYYSDEGWASGRDLISDNDRHSYHWGRDTGDILDRHAARNRGDRDR